MNYWLFKSEPGAWSWDDQIKKGVEHWDGVRNYQANNNMKAMKKGDKAFFYHSVDEKRIVGIMKVVSAPYPDPTAEEGSKWVVVDVKPLKPVKSPVTLADVKADDRFAEFALVRQSRLSVVPVTDDHWAMLCEMGGVKP